VILGVKRWVGTRRRSSIILLVLLAVVVIAGLFFVRVGGDLRANPVAFEKSALQGTSSNLPTSLQFGPDGRLYVSQYDGTINAYTIERNSPNSYEVTETEAITEIQSIPNYNDDGSPATSAPAHRLVTGILVIGTETNPIIYATSNYPWDNPEGEPLAEDPGIDTNSGVLSRLTWTGSEWEKLDLVRGLPRSEANHNVNGLQLNPTTNKLYIGAGANTNAGAPSKNFALLPEVALSAAILEIDLNAIGNTTYDLPTLDDEDRTGAVDLNDPFGGNDGKNQARLVADGPVQVYAPGFRNPYDVLITRSGRMYTIDNGSNAGWGHYPANEGPDGTCTHQPSEAGITRVDTLHFVSNRGYYGGHPNPTRGNKANVRNADQQSPISTANPIECDYREPGAEKGELASFDTSTNGLAEYTASNFDGGMDGDLLAVSWDKNIYRIKLNDTGDKVVSKEVLASEVSEIPLDITTRGDDDKFPGTIWVADLIENSIIVFEPRENAETCEFIDDPNLDADQDGFNNADEIDSGTDQCSPADVPPDYDGDKSPNPVDPDDDDDGLSDLSDPFSVDPRNGADTNLPVFYGWDKESQGGASGSGGLLDMGFTGLMANDEVDYESLFDPAKMTIGGAAGTLTIDEASEGTAQELDNAQEHGFQFGINATANSEVFTVHTRVVAPFAGLTPENYQSMGLFIGTGDQDNYVKLITSANGGAGGVEFAKEIDGTFASRPQDSVDLPGPDAVDLFLTIDPVTSTVQPSYIVTDNGVAGSRENLGDPEPIPAQWFGGDTGLAVGIISTSIGPGPEFPATWDFIEVYEGSPRNLENES
jgi:hypothetical protein